MSQTISRKNDPKHLNSSKFVELEMDFGCPGIIQHTEEKFREKFFKGIRSLSWEDPTTRNRGWMGLAEITDRLEMIRAGK